jgi:hypothetical protein
MFSWQAPPDLFTRPLSTDVIANKVWRGERDDRTTRHCGTTERISQHKTGNGWSGNVAKPALGTFECTYCDCRLRSALARPSLRGAEAL